MPDRLVSLARRRLHAIIVSTSLVGVAGSLPAGAWAAQTFAELMAINLNRSTGAAIPPDETGRIFVTEQFFGNIRVVDLTTRTLLPDPMLTLAVSFAHGEQGLLGLVFDPNFAENGYFYVNYTGFPDANTRIERYRMLGDPATSNVADPASKLTIVNIAQPQPNHNGGWLAFGPDDYLYIGMGDGGNGLDFGPGHTEPGGNAQDLTDNLLGKILRIDVSGDDFPEDDLRNYAIPPDNPFVAKEGDDEIWAYGLRNPWRASFDRETGDLWIGDVGEGTREEINFLPAGHPGGANFGWRLREGSIATPNDTVGGPRPPGAIDPVYDYPHSGPDPDYIGGAVTGGFVYRGPVPEFQGLYFFCDTNLPPNIWTLDPDAVDIPASVQTLRYTLPRSDTGTFLGQVPSFTEDAAGNLYSVQLDAFGGVFRIATNAKDATWNGTDPNAGAPGDGAKWTSNANWTRDGIADTAFVADDQVIFAAGSSQPIIDVEGEQVVSAARFQAPYTLENGLLRVISGNITVAAGVTATIASDLLAASVHRSIRKMGVGTLLVNGNAGQTVVKEGVLGGNGTLDHLTVRDGGMVAPGAPIGVLSVDETFTMHEDATLQIELNGADNSNPLRPQYDQLLVGGAFTAAGELRVALFDDGAGAFLPSNGDTFDILVAEAGLRGEFDEIKLPALPPTLTWQFDRSDDNTLRLLATPTLAGDYNANGEVDAADYVVWRSTLGRTDGPLVADGTGPNSVRDRIVDQWDYDLWRANFGNSLIVIIPVDATAVGIPEPASLLLISLAAMALFVSRRPAPELPRVVRRTGRG
jgi:glucose/arabinose dehydrogenase